MRGATGGHTAAVRGFKRRARPAARRRLETLWNAQKQLIKSRSNYAAKAAQFATNPLGPLPKGVEAADAAAWTVVANVILNLDEVLMKR